MYHVYVDWTLEDTPRPFYVGKGNSNRTRLQLRNQKHSHIRITYGMKREIVFSSEDEQECLHKECEIIALYHTFYRDPDANELACNFTKGGDGTSGWVPTIEQRENISKGVKQSIVNDATLSARKSALMTKLMSDPVHREKVSLGIKNAFMTMSCEKRASMLARQSLARSGKPSPVRGSKNPRTILNEDDVRSIRRSFNEQTQEQGVLRTHVCRLLMSQYNVGYNTIYKIVTCATWQHVEVK